MCLERGDSKEKWKEEFRNCWHIKKDVVVCEWNEGRLCVFFSVCETEAEAVKQEITKWREQVSEYEIGRVEEER